MQMQEPVPVANACRREGCVWLKHASQLERPRERNPQRRHGYGHATEKARAKTTATGRANRWSADDSHQRAEISDALSPLQQLMHLRSSPVPQWPHARLLTTTKSHLKLCVQSSVRSPHRSKHAEETARENVTTLIARRALEDEDENADDEDGGQQRVRALKEAVLHGLKERA